MRTFGIIVNSYKDEGLEYAERVLAFLSERGACAFVLEAVSPECMASIEKADFLVVLGGDGTMLAASAYAACKNIPLIGINFGNLGFLTDVEKEQGFSSLSKVLEGDYSLEKRMLLEADFPTAKPLPLAERLALNEVNICGNGRLTEFSVYVGESPLNVFRADGVVVATPTGSTAYSLSAGGPLLMPSAKMSVITPISPHSLGTRPFVIDNTHSVRIVIRGRATVIIDGKARGLLASGQSASVQASSCEASIIKTVSSNIYTTLRKKKMIL